MQLCVVLAIASVGLGARVTQTSLRSMVNATQQDGDHLVHGDCVIDGSSNWWTCWHGSMSGCANPGWFFGYPQSHCCCYAGYGWDTAKEQCMEGKKACPKKPDAGHDDHSDGHHHPHRDHGHAKTAPAAEAPKSEAPAEKPAEGKDDGEAAEKAAAEKEAAEKASAEAAEKAAAEKEAAEKAAAEAAEKAAAEAEAAEKAAGGKEATEKAADDEVKAKQEKTKATVEKAVAKKEAKEKAVKDKKKADAAVADVSKGGTNTIAEKQPAASEKDPAVPRKVTKAQHQASLP